MDPTEALRRCSGVASQATLVRLGVPVRDLQRAVRAGDLVRHSRGYTTPGAPAELVAAARWGGAVGCVSALSLRGVPMLRHPPEVHLLVASARATRGVRVHRCAGASGLQDLVPAAGRALRCLPRDEALAVADALVRSGIDTDLLATAVGGCPGSEVRWVLRHADARMESPIESVLRAVLIDLRLAMRPQVSIPGVGRVDFLVQGWLVLEADGYASHGNPNGFQTDRRRDAAAARLGLATLRFTYNDLVHRREQVAEAIQAVVGRRRRRVSGLTAGTPGV